MVPVRTASLHNYRTGRRLRASLGHFAFARLESPPWLVLIPESQTMPLQSGTKLGTYEIIAAIGAGGMGEVYRAKDSKLGREVAIKVLPDALSQDKERLARFEREAKLLASLNHPGIATLFGLEEDAGKPFLVMELVEGETLSEQIARGPLPVEVALPLFQQIAEALEAAHEKAVIHRDLKPANIKVTPEGKVKVLDFGLAKAFAPQESEVDDSSQSPTLTKGTALGAIMGTASYMSPEQARGKPVDKRTDVWAFGSCLYEALSGKKAFEGDTVTDTISAVVRAEPDWNPLSKHPQRVRRLLARCLQKDPRERLRDIGDARIEIRDALTEPTTVPGETQTLSRRASWLPAVAVGVILSALFFAGLKLGWFSQSTPPRSELSLRQLTANPIDYPVMGAAISGDGKYLAYVDPNGLFLRLIDSGETHSLSLPEAFRVSEIDWFPDGTHLLLGADAGEGPSLWKIPILGGTPAKLADGAHEATISPDGSHIAFFKAVFPVREIYLMRASGEALRSLVTGGEGDSFSEMAWAPDGKRLAFGKWRLEADGSREMTIESIHLETNQIAVMVSGPRLVQKWRGSLPFCWTPDGRLLYALQEPSPNQDYSNLWEAKIDLATAKVSEKSSRLTQLSGYNFRDLHVTSDGSRLTFLLERNQSDVYVGDIESAGRALVNVRRLTLDERDDYPGDWTLDGSAVLFSSNRGGTWDVFKQDINQRNAETVLAGPEDEGEGGSVFSADGDWILYWVSDKLMRKPVSGGPPELILAVGEQIHCARSPLRGCVLGERDRDKNQYIFSALDPITGKGDELLRIEDNPPFTNWDISPDGTRIAVVHNDDRIRIFELSSGEESVISQEEWIFGEFVAWSVDGEGVYLDGGPKTSDRRRRGLLYVSLKEDVTLLRQTPHDWHVQPVTSPDGRHLAFASMFFSGNAWMIEDF